MSLYIYLNEEAHEEAAKGLEGSNLAYRTVCLHGINVSMDSDGRLHYEVKNETGPMVSLVPIPLRKFVESISWQTHLPPDSLTQTLGRYIHESAEAIVDHRRDRQGWRTVRISGPVIEEVYRLYYQLRAGQATLLEAWQETEEPLPPVKFASSRAGRSTPLREKKSGTERSCSSARNALQQSSRTAAEPSNLKARRDTPENAICNWSIQTRTRTTSGEQAADTTPKGSRLTRALPFSVIQPTSRSAYSGNGQFKI